MTVAQVGRLAGKPISLKDDPYTDDAKSCAQVPLPGHEGVFVLFENMKLTSIWLGKASRFRTEKGIRVGDTEQAVRKAYPQVVKTSADYDDPPAANLTLWVEKDVSGLVFRTGADQKVVSIAAGAQSITYMEGCL